MRAALTALVLLAMAAITAAAAEIRALPEAKQAPTGLRAALAPGGVCLSYPPQVARAGTWQNPGQQDRR